jgi:hypothetical protein
MVVARGTTISFLARGRGFTLACGREITIDFGGVQIIRQRWCDVLETTIDADALRNPYQRAR